MCDWEYVDIWNTEKMVLMSNERLNRVERARRKKKSAYVLWNILL